MAVEALRSERFPYLPLTATIGSRTVAATALLDTGFDGDLVVPMALIADGQPPDEYRDWGLADGAIVVTPVYYGTVQLGSFDPVEADIALLGEEPKMGRGISDRYRVTLDHGERVIVEP